MLVYIIHKMWNWAFSCGSPAVTAKKCTTKCDARAKLLFCLVKLLLFFISCPAPPHLKLSIIYNTLWSMRNRIFSVQIELLPLIASETFFDSSVVPLSGYESLVNKPRNCGEIIAVVYELTKICSPIGHNNTMHFLCPIRSQYLLDCLEMVRWESVPRGSSASVWKLSSHHFSRPNWLPLGPRGW